MKQVTPFTFDRKFGDHPNQRDFSPKIPNPDVPEDDALELLDEKPAVAKKRPAKS